MTIAPILLDAKAASLVRRVSRAGRLTGLAGDRAGLIPGCQIQFFIHVCILPRTTLRPVARATSTALAKQGTRIVGRKLFRMGHLLVFGASTTRMSRSGTEWVSDVKWIKRWATAVRDIAKADAHAAKRQTDAAPGKAGEVLGEYATLHNYLAKRYANIVLLTFDQIEGLLGFRLPDSAPTRQEWWAETCRDGTRDEPSCSDAWVLAGMNGETESVGPDKQHPRRAHLASLFAEVLHSR